MQKQSPGGRVCVVPTSNSSIESRGVAGGIQFLQWHTEPPKHTGEVDLMISEDAVKRGNQVAGRLGATSGQPTIVLNGRVSKAASARFVHCLDILYADCRGLRCGRLQGE